ncbi:MAG: PAS domain-containing protein [Patescibacteria group bacterium]|nr:PAS domain-containing protein [Patescibacteria group bacterium]
MNKIINYLDPMVHLGEKKYSILFPFLINFFVCILSEAYAYSIAHNPMAVGAYSIFINVALIIYFAFREGIRGGFTSTFFSIAYYFYIIFTRHYTGSLLTSGIGTIIVLAFLYSFLGFTIGWLKQQIDTLIEIQADERKRLETIIQQLPIGAIITDDAGRITNINKQVATILGFTIPIGFTLGKNMIENVRINGKRLLPNRALSFNVLSTGKAIINREQIYEHTNKGKVYLRIDSSPILNSKKKIIAAATTISDITRQKKLEQQKDDFIAMASHELKTPITSIKVFTQVLGKHFKDKKDSESQRILQKMDKNLDKLDELVRLLLDVSRIEQGKLQTKPEKFFVRELVEDIIEDIQPITRHKLILDWRTTLYVYADKERIRQVLVNLITNAIKYSPHADKIIMRSKKNRNFVEISVEDFGIGISKKEQNKIFGRFYQADSNNTYPGLGLGLYISQQIIKLNGGKMWVKSEEGKGSTFYFRLPIHKEK